jgi:branched-chain amino acid transport system permease protein
MNQSNTNTNLARAFTIGAILAVVLLIVRYSQVRGSVVVLMAINAVLALSLYLPLMTGQLSLASPGFYAIGGYIAAIFSTKVFTNVGTPFPIPLIIVEMAISAAVCGFVAVLVGIPALRLRGIYLALATIAFVEILRVASLNAEITGGAVGIFGIPQPFATIASLEYLYMAVPLLLFSMFFVARLERSRVGRAFAALREDELAANAMGINPTYFKVLSFALGAMLAGVAGALAGHFLNTWNARQGTFDASILILAYVLVGGSRTFIGPVLGAALLSALPELLRDLGDISGIPAWLVSFFKDGRLIIFGLLIAAGAYFFPYGLITPEIFRRRKRELTPRALNKAAVQEGKSHL